MKVKLKPSEQAMIQRAILFKDLHEKSLEQLLSDAVVKPYKRGEILFFQGEPANFFYLVLEGWVKVYRVTPAGEEAIVGIFTKGTTFAEAAVFTGGEYPASAEAATDCRLLIISADHLTRNICESPEIGLAMLASTSRHLHHLVVQIEQLKTYTGAQRVAEFFVSLAPAKSGSCVIEVPYDKTLLAGKLGLKPESLSRAFRRLIPYGLKIERKQATIDDIGLLSSFSEIERSEVMRPKPVKT